jgi:hypothetical protein
LIRRPDLEHSYLLRALIATGVLYFALDLSAGDRGVVDWAVIGVVGVAILYNLVQLWRLLYEHGGGRALWHGQRTVLFWIIGLFNTVWIRPADVGTWKNWLGWLIVAMAVADTIVLQLKQRDLRRDQAVERSAG